MRILTNKALLATICLALVSSDSLGQATIYNWIAADSVANWNEAANWDSVFGNEVPDADAFDGESALINNGRTARAELAVPKVAGLEVRNGAVDIPSSGSVQIIADDVANGNLLVATAGSVSLSGSGQLIVAGDVTNGGTVRLSGPDASLTVDGDFATTGTLAADIEGDSHAAIMVEGAAELGGRLEVEVSGITPVFGQSWDLLNAASLSGRFEGVDATSASSLPRGLRYQVTTNDTTASLHVGNALIAIVNRQTGDTTIENAVGEPVEITGYALQSKNGLLAANWQGVLGEGWTTANPSPGHVSELNLSGSRALDVGTKIDLGNTYAGNGAGPTDEDIVFEYTTLDGRLLTGSVEYAGALNDLVLHVDPTDGSAAIANRSRFIDTPDLTGYAIRSDVGGLTVNTWTSFADTGAAGDGWTPANPDDTHLAELNLQSSKQFTNGTLLSLGRILAGGDEPDLLFEYTTTAGELRVGTVQYGPIPTIGGLPGDCNLDGQVDQLDLECVSDIAERDAVLDALNSLPGDLNGDGTVAFTDFVTLSTNYNVATKTRYVDGNVDLENGVAFPDFVILSTNYNKTPDDIAAVPEPSAKLLTWLALIAFLGAGRRHRKPSIWWAIS